MGKDEFWDRVKTVNAGMLDGMDGARWVPMSHHADAEARTLWFITAAGTEVAEAIAGGPRTCGYLLADNGRGLFAHLTGTLSLSQDRAKLADLWSPVAGAWFDGGIDDPDLRLLAFRVTAGEVWITPTSGVRFMFSIARARITGADPDPGDHFTL